MRNANLVIFVAFVRQVHADEQATNGTNKLVDQLFNRAIEMLLLHRVELDHVTLEKPTPDFLFPAPSSRFQELSFQHFIGGSSLAPSSWTRAHRSSFPIPCVLLFHRCSAFPIVHSIPDRLSDLSEGKLAQDSVDDELSTKVLPAGSMVTVRMPEDGASLFHALAHGLKALGLEDEDGASLNFKLAAWILQNADEQILGTMVSQWVDWYYCSRGKMTDQYRFNTEKYADDLILGRIAGGNIELHTFCHIWRVDVGLYQKEEGELHLVMDYLSDPFRNNTKQKPRGKLFLEAEVTYASGLDEKYQFSCLVPTNLVANATAEGVSSSSEIASMDTE